MVDTVAREENIGTLHGAEELPVLFRYKKAINGVGGGQTVVDMAPFLWPGAQARILAVLLPPFMQQGRSPRHYRTVSALQAKHHMNCLQHMESMCKHGFK